LTTVNSVSVLAQNSSLLESDGFWSINGKELSFAAATCLVVGNSQSVLQIMTVLGPLNYPPKVRALAVYTDDSTATIIAPNGLILNTYPKYTSQVERLEHDDVEITIPLKSMWMGESTLRLEHRSPLLRIKAVEWIYEQALLPLSKWIIASIFAFLAVVTKDKWLTPFVIRLLRRIGIRWPLYEWKLNRRIQKVPLGSTLRIISDKEPFTLHWAFDKWTQPTDTSSFTKTTSRGKINYADIPIPLSDVQRVLFTFMSISGEWETPFGTWFEVDVAQFSSLSTLYGGTADG
jgi:hypothetical protein